MAGAVVSVLFSIALLSPTQAGAATRKLASPVNTVPSFSFAQNPGRIPLTLQTSQMNGTTLTSMQSTLQTHYDTSVTLVQNAAAETETTATLQVQSGEFLARTPLLPQRILAQFPGLVVEAGSIRVIPTGGPLGEITGPDGLDDVSNIVPVPWKYPKHPPLPELDLAQFDVTRGGAIKEGSNGGPIDLKLHFLSEIGVRIRLAPDGTFSARVSFSADSVWVHGHSSSEPHLIYSLPRYSPKERLLTESELRGLQQTIQAYLSHDYPMTQKSRRLYRTMLGKITAALP